MTDALPERDRRWRPDGTGGVKARGRARRLITRPFTRIREFHLVKT
ncbi:hypothetical protein [Synechococcus sp. CC9616]|nr:hypothetical protein [Synechococcus sp. CC9616]